jgi:hypothetical protein
MRKIIALTLVVVSAPIILVGLYVFQIGLLIRHGGPGEGWMEMHRVTRKLLAEALAGKG